MVSSKPSREGVTQLRCLLSDYRKLSAELATVRREAAKLQHLEARAVESHQQIIKQLEGMDCKSDGNGGWEQRAIWMLCELQSQMENTA